MADPGKDVSSRKAAAIHLPEYISFALSEFVINFSCVIITAPLHLTAVWSCWLSSSELIRGVSPFQCANNGTHVSRVDIILRVMVFAARCNLRNWNESCSQRGNQTAEELRSLRILSDARPTLPTCSTKHPRAKSSARVRIKDNWVGEVRCACSEKNLHNRDRKAMPRTAITSTHGILTPEKQVQPVWDTTCNALGCFPRGRSSINSPTGSSLRDTRGVLLRHSRVRLEGNEISVKM